MKLLVDACAGRRLGVEQTRVLPQDVALAFRLGDRYRGKDIIGDVDGQAHRPMLLRCSGKSTIRCAATARSNATAFPPFDARTHGENISPGAA